MPWRALTEDDILTGLSGPESAAYRTKALASGQDDPLPGILLQVAGEIRGAIRSHPKNRLSDDATEIPADAIYHAIAIVRYRLLSRLVGTVTDTRKDEWHEANRWKRDVASGAYRIEPPDTDPDAKAPKSRPSISSPTLTHERTDAEGL